MSIRNLVGILLAVAVLFAPSLTGASAAMAAVPGHQMQMMASGHCKAPASSDHQKMAGKSCCVAMCMALAVAPATLASEHFLRLATPTFFVPKSNRGYLGEISTPPPRAA